LAGVLTARSWNNFSPSAKLRSNAPKSPLWLEAMEKYCYEWFNVATKRCFFQYSDKDLIKRYFLLGMKFS
jgi:hypothetical protein